MPPIEQRTSIDPIVVSVVVPVLNEVEAIDPFLAELTATFEGRSDLQLQVVFVNDGSTDGTLDLLLGRRARNHRIVVVDLSRNFGKEAAMTAGLEQASGQVVVPIDVDLQDPPRLILDMIEKWREGYDVVLGRRTDRYSDSLPKRLSAEWFYRVHNKVADSHIPEHVGDFRLMDRSVVDALELLPESRRFMKGLFAWVGFRTTHIDYRREPRRVGRTKFNGWKLWNFALEGITSFSTSPLRIWTYIGIVVSGLSFLFTIIVIIRFLMHGSDVAGYPSLIVAVTFLGGLQLIGIGVLGEYLGRTYIETKRRPVYIVRHIYQNEDQ